MKKVKGLGIRAVLLIAGLALTACDLYQANQEDDLLKDIDRQIEYANAPYANVSIGIIAGSLSAAPTEAPREKVGYPFSVQAAANSGYGFAGWRVLNKADWDALNQSSAAFESDFLAASFSGENELAAIADDLGVDNKPSGGAAITAHTAAPLVIVPYAVLQPAISNGSYPAMNAYDVPYTRQIEIRFDVPVSAESLVWQEGETPAFSGDIKNVSIHALKPDGARLAAPEAIEALFVHSLDEDGMLLRLQLDTVTNTGFNFDQFNQCKITVSLGADIERRGAAGVKIMPRQELIFTVTTNIGSVDTRLGALEVNVGGNELELPSPDETLLFKENTFEYIIKTHNLPNSITIKPVAKDTSAAISILGATVLSGNEYSIPAASYSGGGVTIGIDVRASGASTRYTVIVNNYPEQTKPTVSLAGAVGHITANWTAVNGAAGYRIHYGRNNPDFYSASSKDVSISELGDSSNPSTTITGQPGQRVYVWVQAYSGTGASLLLSPPDYIGEAGDPAAVFSTTNTLSSLAVAGSVNGFSPAFYSGENNYTLRDDVSAAEDTITVNFSRADPNASVAWQLNSGGVNPLAANATSLSFDAGALSMGENTLKIKVTPQTGENEQAFAYNLIFYKKPPAPQWAAAPLVPNPGDEQISVHWQQVAGVSGYEVYRNSSSANPTGGLSSGLLEGDGTLSHVSSEAVSGTVYYFWLRSYKTEAGGHITYSDWAAQKPSISTNAALASFTINASPITELNYAMPVGFTATSTLALVAQPSSGNVNNAEVISSDAGVNTAGLITGADKKITGNLALNWNAGDPYAKTFAVKTSAQHTFFTQEYTVTVNRQATVPLAGSLAITTNKTITKTQIFAYANSARNISLGSFEVNGKNGAWSISNAPSAAAVGVDPVYWTLLAIDNAGNAYEYKTSGG
jgi:hypothetical protein